MSEWKECILEDIAEIVPGFAFKSQHFSKNVGQAKVVKITDITPPFIEINDAMSVNLESYDKNKLEKYIIKKRDFVIAMTGATIGKVGRMRTDESAYINQRVATFRSRKNTVDDFVYYSISCSDFQAFIQNNIDSNSAQENISGTSIGRFPVLLPSLPEQRAIASVLSSLDDKIDLLHRQNKTLEAMAETLFRQWFVEEADEGWEEGKLSQLVEIQSGFAFKSEIFVDIGKYKLITIKAVQDGYLELNNADEINEIPPRMPSYCHLFEKDILLSLTGNVGRCCMVDKDNLLLNQRVAKIHPKNETDRAFAYFYFRLRDTRQQLEEMAKGTAQLNLSPVETANMILSVPSRDLLDKFSEISTPLFEGILRNKKNISTLEKLRDSLLPKLMSGEVRVDYGKEAVGEY